MYGLRERGCDDLMERFGLFTFFFLVFPIVIFILDCGIVYDRTGGCSLE
jgi:hypothetical protein